MRVEEYVEDLFYDVKAFQAYILAEHPELKDLSSEEWDEQFLAFITTEGE